MRSYSITLDADAGYWVLLEDGIGMAKSKSRNGLQRIRDALTGMQRVRWVKKFMMSDRSSRAGVNRTSVPGPTNSHAISISHEGPTRATPGSAFAFGGGHRARCSCGWWSDCYSQLSDTQRAVEVHLRRAGRLDFEELLARSSIGAAIADVKKRGIDAHLRDLERETSRRWPRRKKTPAKKESP